ncbi:patatin-like phospholipase family protein [Carboxylicivirga linearis]|uniref:Patatin-like phospholipase family protein n=1 Tax=Carboxylicivirga linearis TaxID=1628157 RepID=A0ABS5JPX0_9BACT|nr:patatin-like phospholipase family protein [Carboxylicivirga linearis]MBS2096929.1 patatin-like phospholipase family protein [Carboxylicivirga linearis]
MTKPFLLIFFTLFCLHLSGQEKETVATRPKVGLVLSGGGAKGLAHIGVIKVLEEAGIKPDYISGTSMGSIIGGLYACGYSPQEMDSIVRNIDWSVILSDMVPLTDVVPIEKGDYNRFQLEFDISRNGLRMPSGMVRGQRISELLSELTWHVSDIESFDDLPIPYRCVAADLIRGQTHVFDSGDMMLAMRSSMAIPTVFTPVLLDSMYLVDGGVLDNFPVKTALNMGADIIIGVNVGNEDLPTMEDLNSITKVLLNSAMIGSNQAVMESIGSCHYLITPKLDPFTASSFFDGIAIMERGETAARLQFDAFKQLADSLNAISPNPTPNEIKKESKILVSKISILNRKDISKSYFYSNLGFSAGDSISVDDINSGMRRLIGTRFYDKITYQIDNADGEYHLIFNTTEATKAKAKFSLRYDNELKAGIVANVTLRNLVSKNSRLSLTTDISEDPRLSTNLITYLGDKQKVGYLTDFYLESTPLPIYREDANKYGTFNYYTTRASLGASFTLKRRSMLAIKANWKEVRITERSGIPELFEYGIERFGNGFFRAQALLDVNTLNKRFFATHGHLIRIGINSNIKSYELYKGLEENRVLVEPYINVPSKFYLSGTATFQQHFPVSEDIHFATQLTGGGFFHDAPFLEQFYIGGNMYNQGVEGVSFAGLNFREKIVENFLLARSEFNYKIGKFLFGNVTVNAIYATDYGNSQFNSANYVMNPGEFILGGSAGLAINSVIGPITFGVGTNASDYKLRGYLSIGYPFK